MSKTIVAFDLETTGLDKTKDYIIQIAAVKFDYDTKKIVDKLNYYVQPSGSYSISLQAYFKHGIKPDFLADKPYFKDIAQQVLDFMSGCDILSYNGTSFDVPFLKAEFDRNGFNWNVLNVRFYDAFIEEKKRNGNRLEETYTRYYGKSMEESGLKAHDAYSDVMGTIGVFYAQQKNEQYESFNMLTEDNLLKIQEFRGEQKPCFTYGKYKDLSIELVDQVDQDYLKWCVSDKSSFCQSTKRYINSFIKYSK